MLLKIIENGNDFSFQSTENEVYHPVKMIKPNRLQVYCHENNEFCIVTTDLILVDENNKRWAGTYRVVGERENLEELPPAA